MKDNLLVIVLFIFCNQAYADFEGELILEPSGCEATRECYIKNALRYTDPDELVWEAKKGLKTDGATIPEWAQPFVGAPYDRSFLKAAVVHDHYCDRHVRSWRSTHRAFYHMLIDLGVPKIKSKILYYAVFVGGPKWIEIIQPKDCGANCINEYNSLKSSEKIRIKPESFNEIDEFDGRLKNIEKLLEEEDLTLEQIDELAKSEQPGNVYFENGDTIEYGLSDAF